MGKRDNLKFGNVNLGLSQEKEGEPGANMQMSLVRLELGGRKVNLGLRQGEER